MYEVNAQFEGNFLAHSDLLLAPKCEIQVQKMEMPTESVLERNSPC